MKRLTHLGLATLALFLASPAFAINQCTCQVGVVTNAKGANGLPVAGIDKRGSVRGAGYGCYVACRQAALDAFTALNCGAVTTDNGLGQETTALCFSFLRNLQFTSPAK